MEDLQLFVRKLLEWNGCYWASHWPPPPWLLPRQPHNQWALSLLELKQCGLSGSTMQTRPDTSTQPEWEWASTRSGHWPKNLLCCLLKALILETRWLCAYLRNYNPRCFVFCFFLLLMPSLNLLGRGPYGDQSAFDASRYIHKEYIRTLGRLPKLAEAEHPFSTKRLHPSHHFLLL